ncbi:MAG: methylated-DNA--[protein]-cysteine S-methyltransferase [Solirubrobacterales bacterium]|nr:methylated-DNA--[protein]-cysteine S-methyltransferase [Solirubrobacterales bacterium]
MNSGVEVRWKETDSPLGSLLLIEGDGRLLAANFLDGADARSTAEQFAAARSARADEQPAALAALSDQLDAYFAGSKTQFSVAIDWSQFEPFQRSVLQRCATIEYGDRISYGELAEEIGAPRAARAVGNALRSNPITIVIPCHRVVRSDGSLGGYGGADSEQRKATLLDLELSSAAAAA